MITIMRDICTKEGLNYPDTVLERIANASGRNLHKALNTLNKFMLNNCKVFDRMDYDDIYRYCTEIIDTMIKGQTIAGSIDAVRLLLYELVNYCVDCITLLPVLLEIAIHRLPETAHNERFELVKIASERDKSIRNSSKDIYHIESFCLHVFRIVKVLMLTKQRRTPKIKVKGVDAT
jgi:DNA polymerase III delta prime subunit